MQQGGAAATMGIPVDPAGGRATDQGQAIGHAPGYFDMQPGRLGCRLEATANVRQGSGVHRTGGLAVRLGRHPGQYIEAMVRLEVAS
jgi:hypothetical protein